MLSKYESFSLSISSMYHDVQKIERMEMAKFGLKGPHAQCLLVMNRYPEGITAAQLCEACEKDKAAISRVISELEHKGLVTRVSAKDTFYRAKLKLTNSGRVIAEQVDHAASVAVNMATQGMSEEDRKTMYECLGLIATNLRSICKNGIPEVQ